MNEKFKILIVGCGELGSRHLQAVATLPTVEEIEAELNEIVDQKIDQVIT